MAVVDAARSDQPVILAEGLRKSHVRRTGSAVQALDGVDLAVPAGTVLGLLGPSGAARPPPCASSPVAPVSRCSTPRFVPLAVARFRRIG